LNPSAVQESNPARAKFSIHPNPNHGEFELSVNRDISGVLEIFNSVGDLVYQQTCYFAAGEKKAINLHSLSAGFYIIKISASDQIHQQRLIIK
jgi:hypothetical protein